MQAWFISDLHLKDVNERRSATLLRFFSSLIEEQRPATHLFLLGDIFDLWLSDSPVFIRKFQAIVDAIQKLKKKGIEVFYVEGNHDIHVKHFWQEQLQIPTFDNFEIINLGPYKVRFEHGDFINPAEVNYLRLRASLRSKPFEFIARTIPGQIIEGLGSLAAQVSRRRSSALRKRNEEPLRQMIRDYAQKIYQETPFDLLVTGHMHVQDDYSFSTSEGRTVRSINLGSWLDGAKALSVSDEGIQFVTLEGG